MDVQALHELLREELKCLTDVDFNSNIRDKLNALNHDGRPLWRLNIMKVRKIVQAHLSECPKKVQDVFKVYKIKNYVMLRKQVIFKRKNKLCMSVPIETFIPTVKYGFSRIVGCDWGIRRDLTCSILDYQTLTFENELLLDEAQTWKKILHSRGEVARLQRVEAALKHGFLKEGTLISPRAVAITNHGLKNKERLKKLAHGLSKHVLEWCLDQDVRIVAMESLKSLQLERGELSRLLNFRINHSPRALLRDLVKKKIRRIGGKCYVINAAHTSQYSSMLILEALKNNEDGGSWFLNTPKGYRTNDLSIIPPVEARGGQYYYNDGMILDADVNASRNLCLKLFNMFE